jgi:hypothetical protein
LLRPLARPAPRPQGGRRAGNGGAGSVRAVAQAYLGHYSEASTALSTESGLSTGEVALHIAAGQWGRAAEVLRRRAARYDRQSGDDDMRAYGEYRRQAFTCLALGAEARAGRQAAIGELRQQISGRAGDLCSLVLADALPRHKRREYLLLHPPRGADADFGVYSIEEDYALLLLEVSAPREPPLLTREQWLQPLNRDVIVPRFDLGMGRDDHALRLRAIAPLLGRQDLPPLARRYRADLAASIAAIRGLALTDDALATAQQAMRDYASLEDEERSSYLLGEFDSISPGWARATLAAIHYRMGDFDAARRESRSATSYADLVETLLKLRVNHNPEPFLQQTTPFMDDGFPEALRAALAQHDFAGFYQELFRFEHHFVHTLALFGWLIPDDQRAEIAAILERKGPDNNFSTPAQTLEEDAMREMAAVNLGDQALAAELRERMARKYEAMSRPESALFLTLLEEL